jgi:prepilin-type N-terminal cleavage/methylation domain-containing protein
MLLMIGNKKTKNTTDKKAGFTLVEMIVSISIFALIAVAIFVRNSGFNSSIILTNLAYEVALSIRQAQVYGLSVREFDPGSDRFDSGYGVNFNGNNKINYLFFADTDNDGTYDGAAELLETYSLRRGNTVGKFCATNIANRERCSDTGELTHLNITFRRPNPDAIISTNFVETYRSAVVHIVAPNGNERVVSVQQTGQISIQQ